MYKSDVDTGMLHRYQAGFLMPAGLDGNPHPIVSPERADVIANIARLIGGHKSPGSPLLVAIDGIDGAGKSTFANEVAAVISESTELAVIQASIDSFHNPRQVRWQRGRSSPLGFYLDSHDLDSLRDELLAPFAAGAGSSYRTAVFDEPSDRPSKVDAVAVSKNDVLIFDGIFLQRPELADYWDLTVFLDGQERVELRRLGLVFDGLPDDPNQAALHTIAWAERFERYRSGMRHYLDLINPADCADVLIDNNDLTRPMIIRPT